MIFVFFPNLNFPQAAPQLVGHLLRPEDPAEEGAAVLVERSAGSVDGIADGIRTRPLGGGPGRGEGVHGYAILTTTCARIICLIILGRGRIGEVGSILRRRRGTHDVVLQRGHDG